MKKKNTKIVLPAIQKGGAGKTTTAAALAQAAKAAGYKALAIDLDPQGNLSFAIGADMTRPGSYDFLTGSRPAADTIQATEQGIDIIRAQRELATLTTEQGSARRLQRALEPVKENYHFIVLDVPMAAGELQYNALQAATGLVIPLQADAYNLQSLYQTIDTARQFQNSNPALKIEGIVFTDYDNRANLSKQMRNTIIEKAAGLQVPYLGTIRHGIAIREAAGLQESLYTYSGSSKPAQDYKDLFERIYF